MVLLNVKTVPLVVHSRHNSNTFTSVGCNCIALRMDVVQPCPVETDEFDSSRTLLHYEMILKIIIIIVIGYIISFIKPRKRIFYNMT